MKRCNDCGYGKDETQFYPGRGKCKECCALWKKKYYYQNRDRTLLVNRLYAERHPDKAKIGNKEKCKRYYQRNKEDRRYNPLKYEANKEVIKERNRRRHKHCIQVLSKSWLLKKAKERGFTKKMIEKAPDILEIIKYSIKIKRYAKQASI